MIYPDLLNKLISYIPADVYAENEQEIREIADAIAKDRERLKEAVCKSSIHIDEPGFVCAHCDSYEEYYDGAFPHYPNCIVRQLEEE